MVISRGLYEYHYERLIKLMDPNTLKFGENLHHVEVFQLIHIVIMENQKQSGKPLLSTV